MSSDSTFGTFCEGTACRADGSIRMDYLVWPKCGITGPSLAVAGSGQPTPPPVVGLRRTPLPSAATRRVARCNSTCHDVTSHRVWVHARTRDRCECDRVASAMIIMGARDETIAFRFASHSRIPAARHLCVAVTTSRRVVARKIQVERFSRSRVSPWLGESRVESSHTVDALTLTWWRGAV